MNRTFTLSCFLIFAFLNPIFGQVEDVSVGPSYAFQAYYDLSTGEVTQVSNDAWDISFSNIGVQDAGIHINESAAFMSAPLKLYLADVKDWSTVISESDINEESEILYNPEESWSEGAFNTVKNDENPLDFGWGSYNTSSHTVEGDKIYIIQQRDGTFLKFQVINLASGTYSFKYANLDGSEEVTDTVSKDPTSDRKLIHYSFGNGEVEMPTDYDLIFQRYSTPLDNGEGGFIDYTVTGVLLAEGVQAVVADGVDTETVDESDYADQYSEDLKTIGHEWKSFSFSEGWLIDDDRAQFVKTKEGDIYKVVFFDFQGSTSGITTLQKTFIGTSSTKEEVQIQDAINIYPNPTSDYIKFGGIQRDMTAQLYDISGKLVKKGMIVNDNQEWSLSSLNGGRYTLILSDGNIHLTHNIMVIH